MSTRYGWRPFRTDRELLEPEPRAWVPGTTGYAGCSSCWERRVHAPKMWWQHKAGHDPRNSPRPIFQGSICHLMCGARCTCWYCGQYAGYLVHASLFISRSTRHRLFSSLSPTSSVSLRPLHLLLPPLAASFASFFFPIFYLPLLHRGGAELLFVPRRPHFASRLEAALLHWKKPPSNHPSIPPCPSSWPRLTCSHLASSAKLP